MKRDRTTRCLLFSIVLLLLINFVTMLLKNPAPAHAQERRAPLQYENVKGSVESFANTLNRESAAGWHVKFYSVTEAPTGSNYHALLEK